MNATHADITDGNRTDIEVELITRRSVHTESGTVHRLIVADRTDATFPVLVATDADSLHDLETGATYRITSLLGAPPMSETPEADHSCPNCGEPLRIGLAFDATGPAVSEAAAKLAFDVPFGVVDTTTTVRREVDGAVDDWDPKHEIGQLTPPAFVCTGCDRHLTQTDLGETPETGQHVDAAPSRTFEATNDSVASPETVGLAAGGAKDATNFRENVAEGYTPKPGAITEEGLFYDYHFETGEATDSDALFAPRYAAANSVHPVAEDGETYLSVGLDSTLSVEDFERPPLELVVALDVSGSMNGAFREYYYDEHGRQRGTDADDTTKIDAATQSVRALSRQLRSTDRLGIVLFDSTAHVAKPLRDVASTDMHAIRRHVETVSAGGGTDLAEGFDATVSMLRDSPADPSVERRVVFMTDMMPNTGVTDESDIERRFSEAAVDGIHTTFVGMGLDENADLVESLSGIRGANHYVVNSAEEFERRLGEEFDYMVTPLVYDLGLELDAEGYEVEAVHGSPSADEGPGPLVHVGTLFPSAKQDGEARGGAILVRLRRTGENPELNLVASWTERNGGAHAERVTVDVPEEPESFTHDGVRKAVALSRYVRALRSWATDVHAGAPRESTDVHVDETRESDDVLRDVVDDWVTEADHGRHERGSVPLIVPKAHAERFDRLRTYLEREMEAVGDADLEQEVELLDTLCQQSSWLSEGVAE